MAGSKISVLDQRNRFLASNCDFFYLTYPWQNLGVSPTPLQNFFMPENICWFGGYPTTPLRKRIRQVIFGGLPKGRPNIIHFWSKKRISLGTACNIKSLFGAEFHISAKPSVASGPEGRKIKRRQISFDCQYSSIFLANVEKKKKLNVFPHPTYWNWPTENLHYISCKNRQWSIIGRYEASNCLQYDHWRIQEMNFFPKNYNFFLHPGLAGF